MSDIASVQTSAEPVLWTDIEREAWKLPEQLTVSEWADRNRVLDARTSAEPGQWNTDRAPYLRGVMDAFNDPEVQEIVLMMSTQVGKTEALLNIMGYSIDQDPAPFLFVSAGKETAENINELRVQPMIKLSPALSRHRTGKQDDERMQDLQLDRMTVFFRGANSAAGLASNPIRNVAFDEVDKYPKFSGREADPIKLGLERTRTFWNRKIILASTPTTREGYIHAAYERSDRCVYQVPCPHCDVYQVLVFRTGVKWPAEVSDPEEIRNKRLAYYECSACKGRIEDRHKGVILSRGRWVHVDHEGNVIADPSPNRRRGFWINALYSPWVSFSEVAAEFLNSKPKDNELMNFINSWLAEVWEQTIEVTEPVRVKKLCQEYEPLSVPIEAVILTSFVDVQKDYFVYTIRAWGAGEESWLVSAQIVTSWEEIENDLMKKEYEGTDGFKARVRLSLIDSGFRTDEVYDFCRRFRERTRPSKGRDHLAGAPFRISKIDRNPKTGKVYEGGLTLWLLDTYFYKDKAARQIFSAQDNPKFHIYQNLPEQYIPQMCSEKKVLERDKKTGKTWHVWKLKGEGMQNHFWDCEVGNLAAAEMLRVSVLKPDDILKLRAIGRSGGVKPAPKRAPGAGGDWSLGGDTNNWMGS